MRALVVLLLAGCATSGMRNGVAQALYEVQKAQSTDERLQKSLRLQRATTVLRTWQRAYGSPARRINDTSFYPVLEEMEDEGGWFSRLREGVTSVLGGSWVDGLLAVLSAVFGAGGLKLWLTNRRHRREKAAMFRAIERSASSELKAEIAKEVTRVSAFGNEVRNSTTPKGRSGLQA
ncbi:MAG: hypothetical protein DRP63_03920 [Planctomycetota bacterium]|nr:MAG: hypothetical protein DRP63_03920 [Planctomycetota bacterium]